MRFQGHFSVFGAMGALVWAAATAACGGSDSDASTGGSGGSGGLSGSGGAAGAAGSTVGAKLDVDAVMPDPSDPTKTVPAKGTLIAFDLPGGVRVEKTVDDNGRATFEGVDWSKSPSGFITGYLPGRRLQSLGNLTAENVQALLARFGTKVLTLNMFPTPEPFVDVSGTATNMSVATHRLLVAPTVPGVAQDGVGLSFSVKVTPGRDFSLVALEYAPVTPSTVSTRGEELTHVAWAELNHAAVSTATTGLTIDLGTPLTAIDVSGSFAIPTHGTSNFFDTAKGSLITSSVESTESGYLGRLRKIDVSSDGKSFEYDMSYVSIAAAPNLFTHYYVWAASGAIAAILKTGAPTPGMQDGVMPEPVVLAQASVDLGSPVTWSTNDVDRSDATLGLNAWITNATTSVSVWNVRMPAGTTELTLPALPTGADPDTVLGSGNLTTRIEVCALDAPEPFSNWCTRWSGSPSLVIVR
jgi:hypothetical protein